MSDSPMTPSAGKLLPFQLADDARVRAITWDGSVSGILPVGVGPNARWVAAPYGTPSLVGRTILDREGRKVGTVPWSESFVPTWSTTGSVLCAAVAEPATTGTPLRLERLAPGQSPQVVARGFATFSDNAGYPVLACDPDNDRIIVVAAGQGIYYGRLWVYRMSTGVLIRGVDYGQRGGQWVATTPDGSTLAESSKETLTSRWVTAIARGDDGAKLATLEDFEARGFSSDGSLIVGIAGGSATSLIDRKTGRRVWSAPGPYGGFFAEPTGGRVAIGVGFTERSGQPGLYVSRDVYVVSPDGSALRLPANVRVPLR